MAFEYTLQVSQLPGCQLTAILVSDLVVTVPTNQSLIVDGDLSHRLDYKAGDMEVPEMTFKYVEDYTNYVDGFWMHVLGGTTCEIRLEINDGGGDTCLFWGRKTSESVQMDEYDLTEGHIRRVGEFTCVEKSADLKKKPALDVFEYIETSLLSQGTISEGYDGYWVKWKNILSAILYKGDLNPSHYAADIIETACDFKFKVNSTVYLLDNVWLLYAAGPPAYQSPWVTQWQDGVGSCFDLLREVCKMFALVPVFRYDLTSSRWTITLITRGNSYIDTPATFPVALESKRSSGYSSPVSAVAVNSYYSESVHTQRYVSWHSESSSGQTDTLPELISPDLTEETLFGTYSEGTVESGNVLWARTATSPAWVWAKVTTVVHWDYSIKDWHPTPMGMSKALCEYYFARMAQEALLYHPLRIYERTYPGITASFSGTSSHEKVGIGKCSVIDDGSGTVLSSVPYFAIEVSKNIFKNETKVKWIEV